jgi:hypothetical protein
MDTSARLWVRDGDDPHPAVRADAPHPGPTAFRVRLMSRKRWRPSRCYARRGSEAGVILRSPSGLLPLVGALDTGGDLANLSVPTSCVVGVAGHGALCARRRDCRAAQRAAFHSGGLLSVHLQQLIDLLAALAHPPGQRKTARDRNVCEWPRSCISDRLMARHRKQ